MKRLSLKTHLKIEFLLLFTGSSTVLETMPVVVFLFDLKINSISI